MCKVVCLAGSYGVFTLRVYSDQAKAKVTSLLICCIISCLCVYTTATAAATKIKEKKCFRSSIEQGSHSTWKTWKMRVHLENLKISWIFEKSNKYDGKMPWNLEKITLDSLETIQNSLNYWSRKKGLLIWSIIETINFLFKWDSVSLHIYIKNHF